MNDALHTAANICPGMTGSDIQGMMSAKMGVDARRMDMEELL